MVYGFLIIITLVAGSLLIFFVESIQSAFRRSYAVNIVLFGAAGLTPDSPVWVGGREVGFVSTLGLMPAGADTLERVLATVELPLHVQEYVRTDSEVRLTSIGPMSERVIDITPGSASAPVVTSADTLRQTPQVTPQQLTEQSARVRAGLNAALAELRVHAPAVRERLEQTERAFAGLDQVMVEVGRLDADLAANPGMALLRDPSFAESLAGTRAHAAELPAMIGRLRDTSGAPAETRAALSRLQLRADSLRARLAAATAALDNPNGTLARMQQDTAIMRAVHSARAELDSLMADIRKNPLRYVF